MKKSLKIMFSKNICCLALNKTNSNNNNTIDTLKLFVQSIFTSHLLWQNNSKTIVASKQKLPHHLSAGGIMNDDVGVGGNHKHPPLMSRTLPLIP